MRERTTQFTALSFLERSEFIARHRGFLEQVRHKLAARGLKRTLASISRTWYGRFRVPHPMVVEVLDSEYLAVRAGRIGRSPVGVDTAASQDNGTANAGLASPPAVPLAGEVAAHADAILMPGNYGQVDFTGSAGENSPANDSQRRGGLRTQQQREERQAWLRERMRQRYEREQQGSLTHETIRHLALTEAYITVAEAAEFLAIGQSTMHQMMRTEPGVLVLKPEGRRRAIIRIPISVLDRIVRRSTVPPKRSW